MHPQRKPTKRVTVVVSKQQKKQNKSRSNTGNGSAKVRQESIVYAPISTSRVTRTDDRMNTFRFSRKEFITTIRSDNDMLFKVAHSLVINAGDSTTFPWLANIAKNFESYRFKRLRFYYIPRCATTTNGFVAIQPDCNPHDPPPSSEADMFQNEKCKSAAPWASFDVVFSQEMLNKRKSYFTRPLPVNADKDLYDVGNLFVCNTLNATFSVGQLWVDYDVEFFTPESTGAVQTLLIGGGPADGVNNANPIPLNPEKWVQSGEFISSIINDGAQSVITFGKEFHGLLDLQSQGTGLTSTPILTNIANMVLNQTEGSWNGNLYMNNAAGTVQQTASMITALAGSKLGLKGPVGGTINSCAFSLMGCGL